MQSDREVFNFDWLEYRRYALTTSRGTLEEQFGRDHENDLTKQFHGR